MSTASANRVGRWYATGPSDARIYRPGDPKFNRYEVISDSSEFPDHVIVRNGGGQEFPVPVKLVDRISWPATVQFLIHLQSMGMVPAKPAIEFQVGESAMWNFGHKSKIIAVVPKGKTQLVWTTDCDDGKQYQRVVKAERLVAVG